MRVYATEDNGTKHLIRLECDHPGCEAFIKPNPDISNSGWVKCGVLEKGRIDHTQMLEWDYCPEHAF